MIQINNTNTPQTLNLKLEDSVEISTELVKNGSFNEIDLTELVQNGSFSQLGTDLIGNGEFDELGTDVITNGGFTGVTELVTNGDFATDTDWTFTGGGVAISGGTLNFTATTREAEQNISFVSGKKYLVTYEITNYVSGDFRVEIGSGIGTTRNSNGLFSEEIVFSGTTKIQLDAVSFFTGSIDSVSVKEVGEDWTNGTGWSFGDSKAISTQALGSEEVTNGDFTGVTNIVLDGDFPLPNVNWIVAATTTINGGSATFEGLGTVSDADVLAAAFVVRVEADGGIVEAESCLISDLTFLTENP